MRRRRTAAAEPLFDFETPYQRWYPRRGDGKTAGMNKAAACIRTQEDYDAFVQAIKNFAAYMKKKGTEKQFIIYWSTFVHNWRDYQNDWELDLQPDDFIGIENRGRVTKGLLIT